MATFHLSIITPEHAFFEGDVDSLVFTTTDGEWCVMAGHQPMVINAVEGEIRITAGRSTRYAASSAGFVTIMQDEVLVMLQTCEWPEEIDIRRAERDRHAAEEVLRQKKSMQEYALASSMLARAMVRLKVKNRNINS